MDIRLIFRKEVEVQTARHLVHEGVLAAVLAVGLIVGLTAIDAALGVVVAIMLFGLLVLIVPVASILYDERQRPRTFR